MGAPHPQFRMRMIVLYVYDPIRHEGNAPSLAPSRKRKHEPNGEATRRGHGHVFHGARLGNETRCGVCVCFGIGVRVRKIFSVKRTRFHAQQTLRNFSILQSPRRKMAAAAHATLFRNSTKPFAPAAPTSTAAAPAKEEKHGMLANRHPKDQDIPREQGGMYSDPRGATCCFDMVLVDGRFREACLLQALRWSHESTVVLLHDFDAKASSEERGYERTVRGWYDQVEQSGSMAVLRPKQHAVTEAKAKIGQVQEGTQ